MSVTLALLPCLWPLVHGAAAASLERAVAREAEASDDEVSLLQTDRALRRPAVAPSPSEKLPAQQPVPETAAWKGAASSAAADAAEHRFPDRSQAAVANVEVPEFVVDLDAPPELRWRNVTRHYKSIGAYPECCTVLPKALLHRENTPAVLSRVEGVLRSLKLFLLQGMPPLSDEHRREFEGIVADVGDPLVTVEGLHLLNLGYEFKAPQVLEDPAAFVGMLEEMLADPKYSAKGLFRPKPFGCSGVLAAMADGTVVHGRNMDYGGFEVDTGEGLLHWPEVTAEVLFLRRGQPLMTSVGWPGQIGVHTAMRFGGWTFEQNTRGRSMYTGAVYGHTHQSEGFTLGVRRIMEATPDFDTAVDLIYNGNWMEPQYFVMAGVKPFQGAVVTVDYGGEHRDSTPPLMLLSNTSAMLREGKWLGGWHLTQTNDDHFKAPRDDRRPQEERRLSTLDRSSVTTEWMMREMTDMALYNADTVFTTVYVPGTGYHRTLAHPGSLR